MPLFNYECPVDGETKRRLLPKPPASQPCPKCGGAMNRVQGGPGVSVVETLDNGLMTRPLERLSEAPRLLIERNKASDNDRG